MLKKIFNFIIFFFRTINIINKIIKKNPRFVFYSENKYYIKYNYLIIKYLAKKFPFEVYYVSSDINDKILNLNVTNVYIGRGFLLYYFFKNIHAKNIFMTTTDLNNNILKKNDNVKNYVYLFHSAMSTTHVYTSSAFDNYNVILCNGAYQLKEIKQREKIQQLAPKKLIKSGFFYFDYLDNKLSNLNVEADEILVAPSWHKYKLNFINEDFEQILENLLKLGYKVRFRPHPETMKRSYRYMNFVKEKFINEKFIFDDNVENFLSMQKSKFLITDNSGIFIEYLMILKRPVFFYGDFDKIHNIDLQIYKNMNPIEEIIKSNFGIIFHKHEISKIKEVIDLNIKNFNKKDINYFLDKNFYNYGKTLDFFSQNISSICK